MKNVKPIILLAWGVFYLGLSLFLTNLLVYWPALKAIRDYTNDYPEANKVIAYEAARYVFSYILGRVGIFLAVMGTWWFIWLHRYEKYWITNHVRWLKIKNNRFFNRLKRWLL